MAADPADRDDLHRLIDQLNSDHAAELRRLAQRFKALEDPMLAVLDDAPEDDEPLSLADEEAMNAAMERYRRGEAIPLEQLERELDEADA